MKSPLRSTSENTSNYFLLPNFPQIPKAQTSKLLVSTASVFERKFSKGSTLLSLNNTASALSGEYFPDLIKPNKGNTAFSKPKTLHTNIINKKIVSFRGNLELMNPGKENSSIPALRNMNSKIKEQELSPMTGELRNSFGERFRSLQMQGLEIEMSASRELQRSQKSFNLEKSLKSSKVSLEKNKAKILSSLSGNKKSLSEKLKEYHIIKKYRKQSFLNLTVNTFFQPRPQNQNPSPKMRTNPNDLLDPAVFLQMKKYRLAKFIVTNLKLKEELFIFEEKKIKYNVQDEMLLEEFYNENPIYAIYDLPELISNAIMQYKSTDDFFPLMNKVIEKAGETKDREFYVFVCKLFGKITGFFGEYLKSLVIYKQCLQDCEKFDLLRIKMSVYKRIGKIYLEIQNIEKAKNNFLKMLHLALILKNKSYEILSYDCLGIVYYYKNDIKKAVYFHTRMLKGQIEGEHSLLRDVAFTKLNTKKNLNRNKNLQINLENLNCSSSKENDSNFFDIKSEDMEYNELKDYKRKFHERRKKTELSKMISLNKGRVSEEINYNTQLYKLNQIPSSKFFGKGEVIQPSKDTKDRLFRTLKAKNEGKNGKKFFERVNTKKSEPQKKAFFLVHLSNNRSLNPYLSQKQRAPDTNYNSSESGQNLKIFLNKSDEFKILNSLSFLKKNVQLAINTIRKMANFASLGNGIKDDFSSGNGGRRRTIYFP